MMRAVRWLAPSVVLAGLAGTACAEIDFEKAILPLFNQHCMECHKAPYTQNGRTKKPKGDLRLDGKFFILKGGDGGKVITPGQSAQSELYTRTILPADHDDVMPPKDGPLPLGDRLVLKQWINEGANFGKWVGAKPPAGAKPAVVVARPARVAGPDYASLGKGLAAPSAKALERLRQSSGLAITALASGSPLVRIDTATEASSVTNERLATLQAIARRVTHLNLGRTGVSDLSSLAAFDKLIHLDLSRTPVTSDALGKLSGLGRLESLNLHSTAIDDKAVPHLAKLRSLKTVYVWNTRLTPAGQNRLKGALPAARIVTGNGLP